MSYPLSTIEAEVAEQARARAGMRRLAGLLRGAKDPQRRFFTTPTADRDLLSRLIRAMPTPPSPQFHPPGYPKRPSEAILSRFHTSQLREVGSIGRRNDVSPCAPRSYDDGR